MSKKRISANSLVSKSVTSYKRASWYDRLHIRDQIYVDDVVLAMHNNIYAAPYLVADALIKELSLSVNRQTVSITLREMVKNAKAKSQ